METQSAAMHSQNLDSNPKAHKPTNWKAKYEKEHERKKSLNKKKKKAYKRIKKLTQQNQELKDQLAKLKTTSFIHEHDYF